MLVLTVIFCVVAACAGYIGYQAGKHDGEIGCAVNDATVTRVR